MGHLGAPAAAGGAAGAAGGGGEAGEASAEPIGREHLRRCFFGDYMDPSAEPGDRQYCEVGAGGWLLVAGAGCAVLRWAGLGSWVARAAS